MFIGCQKDLMAFVGNTKEEIEALSIMKFTEIKEVEFAEMYNGVIYLNSAELVNAKKDYVRQMRNAYLKQYVDSVVSNSLRWADMSTDEQNLYTEYRRYLLDYTNQVDWYEAEPMAFDEWCAKKTD